MPARIKGDSLGDRMKENYESVTKTRLIRRMPVIIRIDGCHFHTFCKHFHKPFDRIMVKTMQDTMKYLCENIQGCVLGYTQSDEITLLLIDYRNLDSSAWFGNELQKVVSGAWMGVGPLHADWLWVQGTPLRGGASEGNHHHQCQQTPHLHEGWRAV